jgi:hypothetical protein
MARKSWWLIPLAVMLCLFGAITPLVVPWRCHVTRAAFAKIEVGMTRAEVEAILGGPPGDYRTQPSPSFSLGVEMGGFIIIATPDHYWYGDEGQVWVRFAHGGGVEDWGFSPAKHDPIDPIKLALWRLGRFKDRLFS